MLTKIDITLIIIAYQYFQKKNQVKSGVSIRLLNPQDPFVVLQSRQMTS